MRIPGWMFFLGLLTGFVAMTGLCAFASYSFVRSTVVDARENGVELPDAGELLSYAFNPPEFDTDELSFDEFAENRDPRPTLTPVISFEQFVANQPTPTNTPAPGETITPEPTAAPTEPVEAADTNVEPSATPLPAWTDPRRLTVLLMGIDQRSAVEDNEDAYRTDTMILVQVDPVNRRVGVLSIPRDLFVNIPGFQPNRITTANYLGDINAYPGGGPALAMETVRANLGVPVDKFVRINFDVFLEVVKVIAPDGVEICVEEPIYDPDYPDAGFGFIEVRFDPGCQILEPERLLQFARTRATQGSDFDRNRRQQQVLSALQTEVQGVEDVTRLIAQIPNLYTSLSDNYRSNISLEEVLALANLVSRISSDDIAFETINALHVEFGEMADGSQILIPRQNAIADVVRQAFDPPRDLSTAELCDRARSEDASIVVYNNTTIPGLAGATREWLTGRGIEVTGVGNIDPPEEATAITIRDYRSKPNTTRCLAALMGISQDAIRPGSGEGLTSADVMIVIGSDVQALIGSPEVTAEPAANPGG